MNRYDFQELAKTRLREAGVLLRAGEASGAYYLAGYAVECGLKACIARHTREHDFPDFNLARTAWTHDLAALVGPAQLADQLRSRSSRDLEFRTHWSIATQWSERSRYVVSPQGRANELLRAVGDPEHGVMPWITQFW